MKILCVCPIGIGNYLMTYPACRAIKDARPDASLHLLGLRAGIADFASGDPLWTKIHVFDPTRLKANIINQVRIIAALRRESYDASLNFFPSNKWMYNFLPFLAGIPSRNGFLYHYRPRSTLSFLCTRAVPVNLDMHDIQQNLHLAASFLDAPRVAESAPVFPVLYNDTDVARGREFMDTAGSSGYIAIHPGSSAEHGMDLKRWASGKFALLADRICHTFGLHALVLGGREEQELKQAVVSAMTSPSKMVPQVSLGNTAAILSMCRLCLCNDSALMHIAACCGTPTVAIFGPTDEKRNGPVGARALVVRKSMPGFPVWTARNVGDRSVPAGIDPKASLEALSVDDAWEQVEPWLRSVGFR